MPIAFAACLVHLSNLVRRTPVLRPARADDAEAMRAFVDGLDAPSRRYRFHGGRGRCSAALAQALVATDRRHQRVWVATVRHEGRECIVGEARFVRDAGGAGSAEIAMVVADAWQGRGVADALLRRLLAEALGAGLQRLRADVMADNGRMQRFLRRHGFAPVTPSAGEDLCFERALALHPARPAPSFADLQALGI